MVAYSFKGRFEDRIRSGVKQQTIRKVGAKRHTRPGERMTMTTGDRFHPRLIGEGVCQAVTPIQIDLMVGVVFLDRSEGGPLMISTPAELDAFAVLDGFDSWADLLVFWDQTHKDPSGSFSGLCINWADTFKAAP